VKFVYNYPEPEGIDIDFFSGGSIAEVAVTAEAAGWDALALSEHPAPGARWAVRGGHQTIDPLVALAAAAAVTTRLKLLTLLMVAAYRNPLVLAKAAATLDLISDERLILGIGAGYHKAEFFAVGADFEARGKYLDEALEVLPLHWRGEPFSYAGRDFDARDILGLPKPRRSAIPIWIGGNAAPTLRRVAQSGQGWMPMLASPEMMGTTGSPAIDGVRDLAEKISRIRDLAGPRASEISVLISYHDISPAAVAVDAARHRERFAELAAIGVTHLVLASDTHTHTDTRRYLEDFGAAYI